MERSDGRKKNVMRILDQKRIDYKSYTYTDTGAVSGEEVADVLHLDRERVFKTLVTVGKSGKYYVFMIPVAEELNLKKAAAAVGEKSVAMIKAKELLPLTGYIHGGCSPIGMKKFFTTTINASAGTFPTIFFSAGKIGCQIEMSPEDLKKAVPLTLVELV